MVLIPSYIFYAVWKKDGINMGCVKDDVEEGVVYEGYIDMNGD